MSQTEDLYYQRVKDFQAIPLWRRADAQQRAPLGAAQPFIWPWEQLRELLYEASHFELGASVHRRVLSLANPGIDFTAAATETLGAGFQMILPGESAPAHRHTMAALRWIVESSEGAYTVVDGEELPMENNDLILTPKDSWHEHRHEGKNPVIWIDGLDAPLVRKLGGVFFENHPEGKQSGTYKARAKGIAENGVMPITHSLPASPIMRYPYPVAYDQLKQMAVNNLPDPYDGYMVEYVNPLTGGHALTTISCTLQLLPKGMHTKAHRHMASCVYYAVKGSGMTIMDGQQIKWKEKDVFALPSWAWHEHITNQDEDAVLFCYSDLPVFEALDLALQENYMENDGCQPQSPTLVK